MSVKIARFKLGLFLVGLTCKAAIKLGLFTITLRGLPNLLDALESSTRNHGQGIITASNHISTLDDPLTWGILPVRYYYSSRMIRWTMGASDIMFTNPLFSTFFRNGQVIETFRGKGIFQEAVNLAIQKLDQGEWIHFYPEGKVNQPSTYQKDKYGNAILPRFKWGIGRVIASAAQPPVVLPMWVTGFDKVMPEGRRSPFKFLPRLRQNLSITFGTPIPHSQFSAIRHSDSEETLWTEITSIVHRAVHNLGKSELGKSLRS